MQVFRQFYCSPLMPMECRKNNFLLYAYIMLPPTQSASTIRKKTGAKKQLFFWPFPSDHQESQTSYASTPRVKQAYFCGLFEINKFSNNGFKFWKFDKNKPKFFYPLRESSECIRKHKMEIEAILEFLIDLISEKNRFRRKFLTTTSCGPHVFLNATFYSNFS